MKKLGILIMMLFVFGMVNTPLKAQDINSIVYVDTNPLLLLKQNYKAFDNVWDYQKKQTKQMVWGLGIGGIGVAGMIYAVNMPVPIRQVNNPVLDEKADEARRDRRIVGASSIVIGIVGAYIFSDSFKWTRRLKAEVGLQSLRLEYHLTGNRRYYKEGKRPKKLKHTKYHLKHGFNN